MDNINVTKLMDIFGQYWDALALLIAGGIKLVQDHMSIQELDKENEERKQEIKNLQDSSAVKSDALARIETKLDIIMESGGWKNHN